MDGDSLAERTTLVERVALLGVAWFEVQGETPARVDEVRAACNEDLDDAVGRLSEADVARSLNRLAATGVLEETSTAPASPVGKGRPAYALADDPDAVLEALRTDEEVAPLVETVERRA